MAVAFNINTIAIYDRTELTKHILYGDQRMTDDDGSFSRKIIIFLTLGKMAYL